MESLSPHSPPAATAVSDGVKPYTRWIAKVYHGAPTREEIDRLNLQPDEVHTVERNLLTNAGIGVLLDLIAGLGSPTACNAANTLLCVGDSTTAASASQTDLQASTNKTRKAMDAGYPSRTDQTLTFQATFGTGDANYAWNEFGIQNGAGTPNGTTVVLINRKVQTLITKTSAATVVLQMTLTFS